MAGLLLSDKLFSCRYVGTTCDSGWAKSLEASMTTEGKAHPLPQVVPTHDKLKFVEHRSRT